MGFFYEFKRYYFPFMERIVMQSPHPRALKTFFFCLLTFFRPPYLKPEHKVLFFIFGLEGHKKVICILSSSLIILAYFLRIYLQQDIVNLQISYLSSSHCSSLSKEMLVLNSFIIFWRKALNAAHFPQRFCT